MKNLLLSIAYLFVTVFIIYFILFLFGEMNEAQNGSSFMQWYISVWIISLAGCAGWYLYHAVNKFKQYIK